MVQQSQVDSVNHAGTKTLRRIKEPLITNLVESLGVERNVCPRSLTLLLIIRHDVPIYKPWHPHSPMHQLPSEAVTVTSAQIPCNDT